MIELLKEYKNDLIRVLKIAKKPSLEETINLFKESIFYSFIVGLIGLVIHIIFSLLY